MRRLQPQLGEILAPWFCLEDALKAIQSSLVYIIYNIIGVETRQAFIIIICFCRAIQFLLNERVYFQPTNSAANY